MGDLVPAGVKRRQGSAGGNGKGGSLLGVRGRFVHDGPRPVPLGTHLVCFKGHAAID